MKNSGRQTNIIFLIGGGPSREAPRLRFAPLMLGLVLILPLSVPTPVRAQDTTPVSTSPVAAGGDFAGLVEIGGGRHLYLECQGQGSPTVILVPGYRSNGGSWSIDYLQPDAPRTMVLPAVAASTRVCTYDRPGTIIDLDDPAAVHDRSDPIPQPTTAAPMVADLHALLKAARVPGPYVLAGHSLGGLLVRLYTAIYPDEVAGLVLVDALSEEVEAQMTPAQWAAYAALLAQPLPGFDALTGIETVDLGTSVAQMRAAATPLRPMPLAVLSKDQPLELPPELPAGFSPGALEQAWQAAQGDLPRLVPNARHSVATGSGHNIQVEQPALVTEAIRQVVEAVRDPETWSAP